MQNAKDLTKQTQAEEDVRLKILEYVAENNGKKPDLLQLAQYLDEASEKYDVTLSSTVGTLKNNSILSSINSSTEKIYVIKTSLGAEVEVTKELQVTATGRAVVATTPTNPGGNPPAVEKWTITYSAGDGTGTAMADTEVTKGESTTLRKNTYTKEGYKFNGWKDQDETTYTDEQANVTPTKNLTLTAQWEAITIASGNNLLGSTDITINGQARSYSNPTIPAGFRAVDNSIDATIDSRADWTSSTGYQYGLVIADSDGNQYVWVPVDGTTVVLGRYAFGSQTIENPGSGDYFHETDDWSPWITKVGEHGGYYIGRYETSYNSTTRKNESKIEVVPSFGVTRAGAQSYAQGIDTANGYTTVTTDLLNSYMWDTAIKFIEAYSGTSNFGTNSGSLGNRSGSLEKCGWDKKCNILDMAGNVMEWTTEYYSSDRFPGVLRGGSYNSGYSAGNRQYCDLNKCETYVGFRSALYW